MTTDSNEPATPAGDMRIAVIGAGNIGRTLGTKWANAGHQVVYGVRTPGAPDTASVADAVASAEVVVLAVPGAAAKGVLARLGDALAGKVVIDATNDVQGTGKLHALEELTDGAHPVARSTRSAGRTSPILSSTASTPTSSTQPRKAVQRRSPTG